MKRRQFLQIGGGAIIGSSLLNFPSGYAATNTQTFKLNASMGKVSFGRQVKSATEVMFYNQSIPGPILKIPQGRPTTIEFHNNLDQATSVHWHGLRINNAMDGVPGMTQQLIQPQASFDYKFTPPDAGTYWYHSHQRSWEQMALGLTGALIVEETHPPVVDKDFVFAVDDWRLNDAGQIDRASLGAMHDWAHGGRMGNMVTVNGRTDTQFVVSKGERVRFRMVNTANSRTMTIRLNQPDISVIAIDGQPVNSFELSKGVITLAPGQRSDLIIDMMSESNQISPIELLIEKKSFHIAGFKFDSNIKREKRLEGSISLPLNPANRIELPDSFEHIPVHIEGGAMGGMRAARYKGEGMAVRELMKHKQIWAFNGIAGLPDSPLFRVKRGTAISLDMENDNRWPHAIHVHGHHFKENSNLDIWRDTTLIKRQQKTSLKFIADNPGKWLIHCHMIEHQAGGMVTWFEVV